jgi:regulator of sigma E protease
MILHILFAIIGLGFLVFIHELGHYLVAIRRGMRVEVFSIGFGKPIYSWRRGNVRWQIGILPFGGYVKIAGMQKEGKLEPHQIPDGFFGKSPWDRIQVALAGPVVNIGFAFLVFCALWFMGGREKNFAEFTHRIGWVDPQSELYAQGVRPGDVIEKYDGREFRGFKDLLMASAMADQEMNIQGVKIDSLTGKKTPFNYTLKTYDNALYKEKLKTIGVSVPANYLDFIGALPPGSALEGSGLAQGDRILWAEGELLYSPFQLNALINEPSVFLTVQRGDEVFQSKIPTVRLNDLQMGNGEEGEVDDWRHEAQIPVRLQDITFIPYTLTNDCVVQSRLDFIDEKEQLTAFTKCQRCSYFHPLQEGDRILAVDGMSVSSSYDLLRTLQTRRTLLIVERGLDLKTAAAISTAETEFETSYDDLRAIVSSIGTETPVTHAGKLHLLKPVVPRPSADFLRDQMAAYRKKIDSMTNAKEKETALKLYNQKKEQFMLGVPLSDREVIYNPTPIQQFLDVLSDTWRTLVGLFSGSLSPKLVSGPVGIVTIIQQSWLQGTKEAIFWLGLISLNLGIMNLLPIPVLDGGHILFSLWEMIVRKPIKAKTMERLIIPFVVLLVAFFIFATYHDILRLFSRFL